MTALEKFNDKFKIKTRNNSLGFVNESVEVFSVVLLFGLSIEGKIKAFMMFLPAGS